MKEWYLIVGCARSGVAAAKFLIDRGHNVIIQDNKKREEIEKAFPEICDIQDSAKVKTVFGEKLNSDALDDVVEIVISPGVPLNIPVIERAKKSKIRIISEVELAYRYSNTPIVAITGTNGKTTTTSLTGEIYKKSSRKTYVVGNIGDPIIKYVGEATLKDVFVAEISSFQLETIENFKPKLATVLNITPDHLDRHKTMENYINAKFRIAKNMDKNDIFLVNLDDPVIAERANCLKCRKVYFSIRQKVREGAYLDGDDLMISSMGKDYLVCNRNELKILGIHNVQNALAATALSYFGGVDIKSIREGLVNFKGVEHRLEFVEEIDGISFVNDSKGTNTNASTIAIKAFNTPIVLIAGGYDKKVSFDDWVDSFNGKVKALVVVGATADKIREAAERKGFKDVVKAETFKEAVLEAYKKAESGDTVLLSPACASWGMFKDYEERGRVFKDIVRNLGGK